MMLKMKASESVKPISYQKANASKKLKKITDTNKTVVITQNGEAKAILQDIKKYEALQDSLALLKILAISNKNLKNKNYKPISESFNSLRIRIDQENF